MPKTYVIDIDTERSKYRLTLITGLFYLSPGVVSAQYGDISIPFEKLQYLDLARLELRGCYTGRLEKGEYPFEKMKEIAGDLSFKITSFVKGSRLVWYDRGRGVVSLSSTITRVKASEARGFVEERSGTPVKILSVEKL